MNLGKQYLLLYERWKNDFYRFCVEACNTIPYGPQKEFVDVCQKLTLDPKATPKQLGVKAGCIAAGEEVLTSRGMVPIESLVGDVVDLPSFDPSTGKMQWQLAGAIPQGEQECLRLTLEDGRALVCTPDHPLWGPGGEARADSFEAGSLIASSRELPELEDLQLPDEEVSLYADRVAPQSRLSPRILFAPNDTKRLFLALLEDRRSFVAGEDLDADLATLRRSLQGGKGAQVTWSKVVHVEPVGVRETYDMLVEATPWFVCSGAVVHNTGVG